MPEEIQLTPEQQTQYDQQAGAASAPVEINPIRDFDANQLAELAVKDKEGFDLVGEFRRNQDLWSDAATVQKVADSLDLIKRRGFLGFVPSDLPGPIRSVQTALESAKGFGKQMWNYARAGIGMAQGAIAEPFSSELATGFAEEIDKTLAKNIAGTEEALTGIGQYPEKIIGKVVRAIGPSSPEQKVSDLWKDVGRSEVQEQRITGQGPFTQAVTGGIAGKLPAEEVGILAAGDPFSFLTFGRVMGLGGKLIPKAVRAKTTAVSETAGDVAATVGGHALQTGGKLTELGASAVKSVAPTVGAIAGGIKGGTLGGPAGAIGGIGIGAAGGKAIAKGAEKVSTAGAKVAEVGKQAAGAAPVTSSLAQAGRDVLQATPGAGTVALGLGQDIGLAALTSETPLETQNAIGVGTVLGVAGATSRITRRVISGQLVAPREYGVNTITPSSGNFPTLDAIHSESVRASTPGEQTRLNAVRLFAKGAAPGTDIFFAKNATALTDALVKSGMSPETANQFAQQEGFFTVNLPDKSGTPRRVIIARNVEAAPHEAFHAVQDVLGESANRELDNIVRQEYADRWEVEGQRYANRLVGDLAGQDWREVILDQSGWGHAEAVEKLSNAVANEVIGQTGAEPPAGFVADRVRAEWARISQEARQRNPNAGPEQVWREILSPEEATAVADRYIARELAAENFDVVFKNLGSSLESNQPFVRKLAGVAAKLISTLGGEPLAGRRSEIGQIEPRFGVTEAVTKVAGSRPTVEPKSTATPRQPVSVPRTPAEAVDAAQDARQIAADAPAEIQAGGTRSPREMLGEIAEAIAQRAGVKINYLSAPDQPAASITSNREARRQIIEAFRTMPPEARALWEKNFFPERVIRTKGGKYQVLGWAPEVFAANAHKLAGWLAEHQNVASPYPVDATTKTFTPEAWRQLYTDVQQFVRNQLSGATGSGEPLVVPSSVTERGFTAPARTGGQSPIAQDRADVINMLFGFKLPETPRIQKGKLPLAIAGEEVSAATLPGRVEMPVRPRGEFTGIEAAAQDIAGRQIQEVNPFRNAVEAAGNPPSLIEAVQRLNLENIKEVAIAAEQPEFRGNTLTLTAGFQPSSNLRAVKSAAVRDDQGRIFEGTWHGDATQKAIDAFSRDIAEEGFTTNSGEFLSREQALTRAKELNQITSDSETAQTRTGLEADSFSVERQFQPVAETANRLVAMSPEEWKSTTSGFSGKLGKGLTAWAWDLGSSAKTVDDIQSLRQAHIQLTETAKTISISEEGGFDRKMDLISRAQAAREAFEAATGSNLEGTNEGSAVPGIKKYFDPNYNPPVKVAAQPRGESKEIRDLAETYAKSAGIDYRPSKPISTVNQGLAEKIADFYDTAQHSPDSPEVQQSYDALASETVEQLKAIRDAGYTIEPWTGEGEPYKNSAEMVSDVRNNKHLFFLPTEGNFDDAGGNLMLKDSGTELGSVNNIFRAVHDFFGHAKEGYQFGPKGEFNAWKAHSEMYSRDAQGALAAETLAQNSWVNFGPKVRGKEIALKDRPFAEQKNLIVPDDLIAEAKGEQPVTQFQPAKQRKQLKFAKTSSGGFKKAWVLPSGEPVQLGGTWHHEWLADNPEVAKKYKLDVPKFTGNDTEQVRESALRAGFARINYGVNNGTLTVEARAKDWRRVKNTVEDMVSANLDDIDNIRVTLFDDAVKEIVDSDSSALFNLDSDQDKLANLPFITKGEVRGQTQFQPKRAGAESEQSDTLFDLPEPKSFPEAVQATKEVASDLVGSPRAKQWGKHEDAIKDFSDQLVAEARKQEGNPAFQIGKRWYSEFTPILKKEFGKDAELMAELLAATSPQTNVETNFGYAIDVLNNWKAGKFDKLIAKLNEGYRRLEDGSLAKIYRRDVRDGKVENPPESPSDATYMAWWILKHDLLPRGTSGQQVGLHSKNVAKVLTRRWLSETKGPKTRNFVQNLIGTGDEATIDIWADRLLRRIGYDGFTERWRIKPENVKGVSDEDFEFGQAVFREAAKQLGMKPSDLQAALWFTEKQRWADNGWSEKLDLGDFRTEIKRTEEYRRGFAEGRGPAEVRQGARRVEPEYEQQTLEIKPRRVKVR